MIEVDPNDVTGEVVIFPAKFRKDEPDHIRVHVNRGSYCTHRFAFKVDFEKRVVRCGRCAVELSHWECIEILASDYERKAQHSEHLKREVGALETRLDVLKQLEPRLRRRVQVLIEKVTGHKADAWSLRRVIDDAARAAIRGEQEQA